jgi:hypothetical protein
VAATDKVDEEASVGTPEDGRLRLRRHVVAELDPDCTRGE